MRPNSQALKQRSLHETEREFGGTLGESQLFAGDHQIISFRTFHHLILHHLSQVLYAYPSFSR